MTRKIFSKDYRTFNQWLTASPRTTEYAKQIIRDHERFPNLSLRDLTHLTNVNKDVSGVAWKNLSSEAKRVRNLAFEVLRSMRKGEKFKNAVDIVGHDAIRDMGFNHLQRC